MLLRNNFRAWERRYTAGAAWQQDLANRGTSQHDPNDDFHEDNKQHNRKKIPGKYRYKSELCNLFCLYMLASFTTSLFRLILFQHVKSKLFTLGFKYLKALLHIQPWDIIFSHWPGHNTFKVTHLQFSYLAFTYAGFCLYECQDVSSFSWK